MLCDEGSAGKDMTLIIAITLFSISIVNFFKCKKYLIVMLICMWIWYLVQYIAIYPLDPKYTLILYIFCFIPPFIVSLQIKNKIYTAISKFFKLLMHSIIFIIVVISSLVMSYYQVYGQFGETQLLGILQTNINESLDGASLFVGLSFFIYYPLLYIVVCIPYVINNYLSYSDHEE